jgi:preprotein translocase subunit SecE
MVGVRVPPDLLNEDVFFMLEKIKQFLKEVRYELTKVTWTTREELIYSTIIVIIVSIVLAVFIGVVDVALSNLASILLG